VYSHIVHGTNDLARAKVFYDAVFATLGVSCFWSDETAAGYGLHRRCEFWLLPPHDGKPAGVGNGQMTAFMAPNRATVDAFHAAAMAHGGTDEGAPGLRPHYHPSYYGAYVRDPDGHKIHCVCHGEE